MGTVKKYKPKQKNVQKLVQYLTKVNNKMVKKLLL